MRWQPKTVLRKPRPNDKSWRERGEDESINTENEHPKLNGTGERRASGPGLLDEKVDR